MEIGIIITMKGIILKGRVKKGYRIASGLNSDPALRLNNTIYLQKPFFEKALIPNISKTYNGTINLDISPSKFKILQPDYEVTCEWIDGVTETFWFVGTLINFKKKKYRGYIYYPCPSKVKSHDDDVVELLTKKIPDLHYRDSLIILVPAKKIKLTETPFVKNKKR